MCVGEGATHTNVNCKSLSTTWQICDDKVHFMSATSEILFLKKFPTATVCESRY